MSAVQQMLFAGRAPITVSGTVYGSGSLSIPPGVTSVSLTGRGGTGTAGVPAASAYCTVSSYYPNASAFSGFPTSVSSTPAGLVSGLIADSAPFPSLASMPLPSGGAGRWYAQRNSTSTSCSVTYVFQDTGGNEMSIAYFSSSPYGGSANAISPTTGPSTTATLNGVTNTWAGGYGGAGAPSSQPLSSTGTGQTLTYSIGSGGYITYSYTY